MKFKNFSEERKELIFKCRTYGITVFLVLAASITFYFLIEEPSNVWGFVNRIIAVLSPIITGFVIAFILNPIMVFCQKSLDRFFTKKIRKKETALKISKYLSVTVAMLAGLAIIAVTVSLIIPNLVNSITQLAKILPDQVQGWLDWISKKIPDSALANIEDKIVKYVNNWVSTDLLKSVDTAAGYFASGVMGVYNFFINFTVGLVVAVYVLSSKDYFKRITQKFLCLIFKKKSTVIEIVKVAKDSHRTFTGFIVGKLVDSLIIGIMCFIFMLIVKMPYALLISFIVGITNIIPFFGPFIGAVPSVLLLLLESPWQAVIFTVFVIILQQFDGNILGPRILKDSLGISSFWVVFSIMLFGGLYGLVGMLIGAPLFAVIYNIVCRLCNRKLLQKGYSLKDEDYLDITKSVKADDIEKSESDT